MHLIDPLDPLDAAPTRARRGLHDHPSLAGYENIERYRPEPYVPPTPIVRTHNLPRLGFPNDIGVLWGGNDEQIEDYVLGVVVNSVIIVGVMAVSLVVMAILKCVGHDRVGFWVGYFEYKGDDDDDGDINDNDDDDNDVGNGVVDEDRSDNVDVSIAENGDDGGTKTIAARTIGSGKYRERSDRVSIVAKQAGAVNESHRPDHSTAEFSEAGATTNGENQKDDRIECNGDESGINGPRRIGSGEYRERSDLVSIIFVEEVSADDAFHWHGRCLARNGSSEADPSVNGEKGKRIDCNEDERKQHRLCMAEVGDGELSYNDRERSDLSLACNTPSKADLSSNGEKQKRGCNVDGPVKHGLWMAKGSTEMDNGGLKKSPSVCNELPEADRSPNDDKLNDDCIECNEEEPEKYGVRIGEGGEKETSSTGSEVANHSSAFNELSNADPSSNGTKQKHAMTAFNVEKPKKQCMRLIGSGEYREKSDHLSIVIKEARSDYRLQRPDHSSWRKEFSEVIPTSNGERRKNDCKESIGGEPEKHDPWTAEGGYLEMSNDGPKERDTSLVYNELSGADPSSDDGDKSKDDFDVEEEEEEHGLWTTRRDNTETSNDGGNRKGPALKRFREMTARIDARDGRIIDLRPKRVPEELHRKVGLVRLILIAFGFGAIVSSGLFYALGVQKFKQSMVDTRNGITQFNELALKSVWVTDELLDAQRNVEIRLSATDKALKVIIRSCELPINATKVLIQYESVKRNYIQVSEAIKDLLNGYGDNMRNVIEFTTWLYDQTYLANIAFTIMVLGMCVMIILIFIMIIGVAFAAYEVENCFTCFMRRVLLLPIFVIQVVLTTILAAIFFVLALSGSDYCVSPDYNAQRMLSKVAEGADDSLSPLFSLVLFYLSGCSKESLDPELESTIQTIVKGADTMLVIGHDIFYAFNAVSPQDMLLYCSVELDTVLLIRYIDELGGAMHNVTHQLHNSLYATLDILSCKSVHPVYSYLVHDAICTGAVGGINSVFTTMLAIAVLSMLMLALRAALYPIHISVAAENSVLSEPREENEAAVESSINNQIESSIQGSNQLMRSEVKLNSSNNEYVLASAH